MFDEAAVKEAIKRIAAAGSGDASYAAEYPTELAAYICDMLIPEWKALFLKKNSGYREAHGLLGVKGCFPDVWRKVYRLKAAFWDEVDTSEWSEPPREILLDLIGHAFMILSLLDESENPMQALCPHCNNVVPVSEGQVINNSTVHDECALPFLVAELRS